MNFAGRSWQNSSSLTAYVIGNGPTALARPTDRADCWLWPCGIRICLAHCWRAEMLSAGGCRAASVLIRLEFECRLISALKCGTRARKKNGNLLLVTRLRGPLEAIRRSLVLNLLPNALQNRWSADERKSNVLGSSNQTKRPRRDF